MACNSKRRIEATNKKLKFVAGYRRLNETINTEILENCEVGSSYSKRRQAWVCGRSLAGTAGLKPAGGMDSSLL